MEGREWGCNTQAICLKPLPITAGCGYQRLVPLTRLNYGTLRRHRNQKDLNFQYSIKCGTIEELFTQSFFFNFIKTTPFGSALFAKTCWILVWGFGCLSFKQSWLLEETLVSEFHRDHLLCVFPPLSSHKEVYFLSCLTQYLDEMFGNRSDRLAFVPNQTGTLSGDSATKNLIGNSYIWARPQGSASDFIIYMG